MPKLQQLKEPRKRADSLSPRKDCAALSGAEGELGKVSLMWPDSHSPEFQKQQDGDYRFQEALTKVKRLLELSRQQPFRFVVRDKLLYREVLPKKHPEGGKPKLSVASAESIQPETLESCTLDCAE